MVELARPGVIRVVISFLLFFTAAIGVRFGAIISGYSQADDWQFSLTSHLESYRPVAALDVWLMQTLFSQDYTYTSVSKFFAAIWYALAMTVLMQVARDFSVPRNLFVIIGTLFLLHPMFNELVLWGVLASEAYSVMLSVVGVALVYLVKKTPVRLLGLLFVIAGALGHQLSSMIGLCVVLVEFSNRSLPRMIRLGIGELTWRIALSILPPMMAVLALLYMRYDLGFVDFASRSIGLPEVGDNYLSGRFYVFSHAVANIYQAPMALVLGEHAALGAFRAMALLLPVILFLLLILGGVGKRKALLRTGVTVAIPLIALAPMLATSATPSGYRLLGGLSICLVFAISVSLAPLWNRRSVRLGCVVLAIAMSVLFIRTSLIDVDVRLRAKQYDEQLLDELREALIDYPHSTVLLCSRRFSDAPTGGPGILESYGRRDYGSYSVWYTQFLVNYLNVHGILAQAPRIDEVPEQCRFQCNESLTSKVIGPFRLVTDFELPLLCGSIDKNHRIPG